VREKIIHGCLYFLDECNAGMKGFICVMNDFSIVTRDHRNGVHPPYPVAAIFHVNRRKSWLLFPIPGMNNVPLGEMLKNRVMVKRKEVAPFLPAKG
jgi:hypothetical protein